MKDFELDVAGNGIPATRWGCLGSSVASPQSPKLRTVNQTVTRARLRPPLRGFSLLEVILALAILTGAIAVIGELVRIGTRNAEAARDLTRAQLLCESQLAEIASGLATAEAVTMSPCPDDQDWLYSVAVESTAETGIVAVRVTFTRNLPNQQQPLEFSMVQWMPDPATATSTDASSEGQSSTTGTTGAGNG